MKRRSMSLDDLNTVDNLDNLDAKRPRPEFLTKEVNLYSDNKLIFSGQTRNGVKHGRCITYVDGFPSIVADYFNGKHLGFFEMFDNHRRKVCHGNLKQVRERYIFTGTYFYFDLDEDSEDILQTPTMVYDGKMKGGSILNLKPDGYGLQSRGDRILYRGHFSNGIFHGFGKKWDGYLPRYEGNFVHGVLQGAGKKYLSSLDVVEGFFLDGVIHGPATHYGHWSKKIIKFEGVYLMGQYDSGRLYLTNKKYFEGSFHGGTKARGKIVENNVVLFDGTFDPSGRKIGRGRQRLSETLELNCIFENDVPYGHVDIYKTGASKVLKMTGTVLRTFGDLNEYIELTDAKLYNKDSVLKFEGSTYFDFVGGIHLLSGMYYVNGFKRIFGNFVENDFSQLYDENGILMMKATTFAYEMTYARMTYARNDIWPSFFEGYWHIFDEKGSFMYGADFVNSQIRDPFKVARKTPIMKLQGSAEDIITMDTIAPGETFFFLNQNPSTLTDDCTKHVVTSDTLKLMKKKNSLKCHPLTRMPIVRIRRGMVEHNIEPGDAEADVGSVF